MRNFIRMSMCFFTVLGGTGCKDLSNPTLPAGTRSPDTYHSREGGLMLAESTLRQFRTVWRDMMINTGLLTDELTSSRTTSPLDTRTLPELTTGTPPTDYGYQALHKLRGQARIARSVLTGYAPDVSPAIRARLYAFEAYAELWLADLYCSGVPLSTLDFNGDFTYQPPLTTGEVYAHAVTLFDSALSLAADSAAIQILARIGKGRAFLALGQYADAEAAVAGVQPNDTYRLRIAFRPNTAPVNRFAEAATVADQEGGNGLPYRTSGDPRTASSFMPLPQFGDSISVFFPGKYVPQDSNWIAMASGIEAQLLRAEAALHRNEFTTWLTRLNALRTTGTYTRIDTVYTDATHTTISRIDTRWAPGEGGVAGLGKLDDPGTETGRIALHFAERAAWLFASAQRQGDLRRLVRVYGWSRNDVYPTGTYPGASESGVYGDDITVPIPPAERRNPMFKGCLNRD